MRKKFFETASSFEPYTALFGLGATPDQVKEAIIQLLGPYVVNRSLLQECAIPLSAEAVAIGRFLSRPDWKAILDFCFETREMAIAFDSKKAFEIFAHFELEIREAQKSFVLMTIFEVPKKDLEIDEFAFEVIRNLGAVIESNLQPYIRELYCLKSLVSGKAVDLPGVCVKDFGQICEMLSKELPVPSLLAPSPWGVRLNQWRNIAQHHSYSVHGDSVVAVYGKSVPPNEIILSREELLSLAYEIVARLGALKTSREITFFNHTDQLEKYLPKTKPNQYSSATALVAAFGTQGFRMIDLQVDDAKVTAILEDVMPTDKIKRPIHCSQFVATIACHFPGLSVQVHYLANACHLWTFEASATDLERVMGLDDPMSELAHIVTFKKEP